MCPLNSVGLFRRSDRTGGVIHRRAWLAGVLAAGIGAPLRAEAPGEPGAEDIQEEQEVQDLARRAGLRPFRSARTEHLLVLGDASNGFLALTLRDWTLLARDYLDYYRAREFGVVPPARRLTVVALADDRSFAAFCGDGQLRMTPKATDPDPSVHGFYSRETNRLVVFDHRSLGPQLSARPAHDNLRTLAHEGTHQLTFNTGLLERRGDVPACLAEGLAMYGEVRNLDGRTAPGAPNRMRLTDLARQQRRGIAWIPVARLLEDDRYARAAATQEGLLAYAESWLLIDYLMRDREWIPRFRAYLGAIRGRRDPGSRLADAREHLGDLDRLDQGLRRYAVQALGDQGQYR